MENLEIRQKVLSGAIWKFAERIIAQVVSLVVSLIIARLLDPSEYGVVSIVTIFFTFANVIISGGLNTALIQKKNVDKEDYNTVFTISFIVAVGLYALAFFLAPLISRLYEQGALAEIIRVLGLSLPIYALKSVVCAYISATLQFRKFFWATIGGTIASAIVGIALAINGYGAWALVAQQLTNTLIDTIILFCVTRLRLSFHITRNRVKGLVGYGSRIMASSLLGVTITQTNPMFIGLKYSSASLSFYTYGKTFPDALSSSITYTISSVLFPALSKYQDDKEALLHYTRTYIKIASFVVFPVMLGFAGVAGSFVRLFLGEKWLPAVYFMQISCFALMFDVVAAGNGETIKAMGRSDVFLRIEIIKKSGYVITLVLFLIFSNSPEVLAISLLVCTAIQVLVNSIPNRKLIGYKGRYQLMDLLPSFLGAVAMFVVVLLVGELKIHLVLVFALQVLAGVAIYVLFALLTKNQSLKMIKKVIKSRKSI